MTTLNTTALGFGRKLLLSLTCCAVAACGSSSNSPSSSGGAGPGTGGSPGASTGGATGTGGAAIGTGGAGTGGSVVGTGGAGTGGAIGATGGSSVGGRGPGTGGAPAAGGNGGTPGCNAVFCDGFEGSMMLSSAWTVDKGGAVAANVVEVVSTKPHTGTNSVHMNFGTGAGATFITSKMGFPTPMNSYWGRVWLFVMTPTDNGHDVYIEGSTGVNTTNVGVRALNTQNGNMSINIAPPDSGGSSNMALPRGAWTCFEWRVAATGAMGNVTLYMGGTQIAVANNFPIPNLVSQRIGYERYAVGAVGDMWIDDYAIGTARIGCN